MIDSIETIYLIIFGEYNLDEYDNAKMSLFILSTILLSLVMLNLVIAIMSDSFDRVIDEKEESDGLELNELVLEAEYMQPSQATETRKSMHSYIG